MEMFQPIIASLQKIRVLGRPRYQAEWTRLGVCLLRWVALVAAVIWIADFYIFLVIERDTFVWGYPWLPAAASTFGAGVALGFVFWLPDPLSICSARRILFVGLLLMSLSAAVIVGLSRLEPKFSPVLGLTLLAGLGVAPLRLGPQLALTALSVAAALALAAVPGPPLNAEEIFRLTPVVAVALIAIVSNRWRLGQFRAYRYSELMRLRQKQKFERLLERTLSAPVVRRLERRGAFPPTLNEVTVIVCDIRAFSTACERMPADMIVTELKRFYRTFDACCVRYGVEPLRSQGDSRVAVAGLWDDEHAVQHRPPIDAILAMLDFRRHLPIDCRDSGDVASPQGAAAEAQRLLWPVRIGIHCGPVMAGVMDGERLTFDIWGDTVNVAARLEQAAQVNSIMVSETLLWATRGLFLHGPLRPLTVKETSISSAASVEGIHPAYADADGRPNDQFWRRYREQDHRAVQPPSAGNAQRTAPTDPDVAGDGEAPGAARRSP